MKSNLPPLPKLDEDGLYPRRRLALDEIRHGNFHLLFQQVRTVFARTLERLILPKFETSPFFKDAVLDVVDVGAAGGLHRRWAPFARHIRSHLFEPEQEAYKELLKRHAGNTLVRIYPNALSRDDKPITIHITAWPRSSGVFLADPQHLDKVILKNHLVPVKRITVTNTTTIDSILERADFIKIDVEGFELAILEGGERLLKQTLGLELEVNFNGRLLPEKPQFSVVDEFCRGHGFILMKLFDVSDMDYLLEDRRFDLGGVAFQANAVYIRPPETVVEMVRSKLLSVEAIWRAAVIYIAYRQLQLAWVLANDALSLSLTGTDADRLKALISSLRRYAGIGRPLSRRALHNCIEIVGPLD
jgi:FkbM family methyltransferase